MSQFCHPTAAQISRCRDETFLLENEFAGFCCCFSHWKLKFSEFLQIAEFLFSLCAHVFLFFLILLYSMWVESVHLTHTLLTHCPANSGTMSSNYPRLALKALHNLTSFILYSFIHMLTYSCVFIKFVFIKHLLCPRYNDRNWKYMNKICSLHQGS